MKNRKQLKAAASKLSSCEGGGVRKSSLAGLGKAAWRHRVSLSVYRERQRCYLEKVEGTYQCVRKVSPLLYSRRSNHFGDHRLKAMRDEYKNKTLNKLGLNQLTSPNDFDTIYMDYK